MGLYTGEYSPTPQKPRQKTQEERQQDAQNALRSAVYKENEADVTAAIQAGADINAPFYVHYTIQPDWDLAYPETKTVEYTNVLHYLFLKQETCFDFISFLIAQGADVNKTDEGQTLLHKAFETDETAWSTTLLNSDAIDFTQTVYKDILKEAEEKKETAADKNGFYKNIHQAALRANPWRKVDDDTISHTRFQKNGVIEITDSFNFSAGERFRLVRDHDMSCLSAEITYFVDMPAQALFQLKDAWKKLQKNEQ